MRAEWSTEYPDEKKRPFGDEVGEPTLPEYPPAYQPRATFGQSSYNAAESYPSYSSQHNLQDSRPPTTHLYSSSSPLPGPSRSSNANPPDAASSSNSGFLNKLKNLAPGVDPEKLLDPPPPCFYRAPPEISRVPFYPLAMLGFGSNLDKGFPTMPPPTHCNPHPFTVHDVNEEDWSTFLNHVKVAASLNGKDKLIAGVAPLGMGIGLAGLFVTKAIEKRMRNKKEEPVSIIVDNWNLYFFNPRRLNVTLAQGPRCISGSSENLPPDMQNLRPEQIERIAQDETQYDSSDSSDSESEEEMKHDHIQPMVDRRESRKEIKAVRKQEKRERKEERKEARRERKEEKKDRKRMRKEKRRDRRDVARMKVRLIVSYFEPIASYTYS
ncbi:hypothetical protein C8Q75DRAFT_781313 [Abortiporus biennis]|nr:hypothetical protein C8Q75DRAFT_781313 [Abortiporus biennis]